MLGNGDIFAASDALAMMAQTGCDGVVVGRGCQGRPWLFAELAAAFEGREPPPPPDLRGGRPACCGGTPSCCARRWAPTAASATCASTSPGTSRDSPSAPSSGAGLAMVSSLDELDELLAGLDLDQPFPVGRAEGPRGRQGSPQRRVPCRTAGWTTPTRTVVPEGAELDDGGG